MLDIQLIRKNPEEVKKGIVRRGLDPKLVDNFLKVDDEWRMKEKALEELKREQNELSKEIAKKHAEDSIAKANILKKRISAISDEIDELDKNRRGLLISFPNMPSHDTPDGRDENENKVLYEVGKKPKFNFEPKDYLSLGEKLGIIDVKKAAFISGSRFGYILGDATLLEFGLVRLAFDIATKHGFTPVVPPVMIRPEVYEGIGRLAADQRDDRYFLEKDNLFLVGSSEHTLAPLHMNEVIKKKDLPKRYIAFSSCFRREAGSYGKDTRGILRVHQFDKVEFFSFSDPEKSESEHKLILSIQEELMKLLKLPYRVVDICTGDIGFTDFRQYDIETWIPSENKYRETHSCSNTTDFQSRGISAKYEAEDGKKEFLHTLNATAFAVGRMLIAIIENYQTKAGNVKVPEILRKYTGVKEIK